MKTANGTWLALGAAALAAGVGVAAGRRGRTGSRQGVFVPPLAPDLEHLLVRVQPGDLFGHVTREAAAGAILGHGFRAGKGKYGQGVYLLCPEAPWGRVLVDGEVYQERPARVPAQDFVLRWHVGREDRRVLRVELSPGSTLLRLPEVTNHGPARSAARAILGEGRGDDWYFATRDLLGYTAETYESVNGQLLQVLLDEVGAVGVLISDLVFDETEVLITRPEALSVVRQQVQAGSRSGVVKSVGSPAGQLWYHLTDRSKFKLDSKYEPSDNALSIEDRSGRPGIYLAREVERWVNGHGYWRPFVVEFEVDPRIELDAGVHGRWGGEMFIPAASFSKLAIVRVIPIDAYARERFGEHGWIESRLGFTFDTREPIRHPGFNEPRINPYRGGYRYPGPDVRAMTPSSVRALKSDLHAFRKILKKERGGQ
jgi:hypothetical protein